MKWVICILFIFVLILLIGVMLFNSIEFQEFFAKRLPDGHTFQAGEYDIQIIRNERKKQLNIQEVRLIVSEEPSDKVLKTDCNREPGPGDVSLYTAQKGELKVGIKNPIGGKGIEDVKVGFKLKSKDPGLEKDYKIRSGILSQIDAGASKTVSVPIGPYELESFTVFCLNIQVSKNSDMLLKDSNVLDEESYLLVIKPKLK